MFRSNHRRLALAVLAGTTASLASVALAQPTVPNGAMIFEQLQFPADANDPGTSLSTMVGAVTINYSQLTPSQHQGGFINILYTPNEGSATGAIWLVKNLPVFGPGIEGSLPGSTNYDAGHICTRFDLTGIPGFFVGQMNQANLTNIVSNYSLTPQADPQAIINLAPLVRQFQAVFGCRRIGGVENSVVGPQLPAAVAAMVFPGPLAPPPVIVWQRNHANIQAANNQCGPAAGANALQFLKNTTALTFTEPATPGVAGLAPGYAQDGTLVGAVDSLCERNVPAAPNRRLVGAGAWPFRAMLKFAAQSDLGSQIVAKHRIGGRDRPSYAAGTLVLTGNAAYNGGGSGIPSTGTGNAYDHQWVVDELSAGAAVIFPWSNATAFHYVQTLGAGYIAGNAFMLHSSDLCQTSQGDLADLFGTSIVEFEWVDNAAAQIKNTNATVVQLLSIKRVNPVNLPTRCYAGGAIPIPESPGGGNCGAVAAAEITIPENFTVGSVNPSFYIPHTWQGDLKITLRKVGGPAITIVDRAGLPGAGPFGFSADNFGSGAATRFRSAAAGASMYQNPPVAGPGIASVTGNWKPQTPLSAFVGVSSKGTWRLEVQDCAVGNIGQIQNFCLEFATVSGTPIPPVTCYANCDESIVQPVLTANDFLCFLNRYTNGDPYANCDGSTTPPILTANDFICFLSAFAAGCT